MIENEKKLSDRIYQRLIDELHKSDTILATIQKDMHDSVVYYGLTYPFADYIDVCVEMRGHISTWMRRVVNTRETSLESAKHEAVFKEEEDEKTN